MNTSIIVNIQEIVHGISLCKRLVRDSSWDKYMLFHFKKALLPPSVWPGTKYTWRTHLKEELTNLFCKLSRYSLLIPI